MKKKGKEEAVDIKLHVCGMRRTKKQKSHNHVWNERSEEKRWEKNNQINNEKIMKKKINKRRKEKERRHDQVARLWNELEKKSRLKGKKTREEKG